MILILKLFMYCFISICISDTLSKDINNQYTIIYFCMLAFFTYEAYKKYNGGALND
ncbi:hypothetical protein ABAL111652_05185 [Abyssicoccus albus]|uniref:Uncharacterized protein n=1 Tax=Abyssicoccus albus TaxID=1817405 RepID=A0A3N5BNU5_9BACL|nr:hypothetical protein EDD62_1420 [Abyssicoccus albus]